MALSEEIRQALEENRDPAYAAFAARLNPNLSPECILGVRQPVIRRLAKRFAAAPDMEDFLSELPHRTYEENNLHGAVLSRFRDYEKTVFLLDAFLPFVDNWATCDMISPVCFRKNRPLLREKIPLWIASPLPFVCRFGIEMVQSHFLDEDFDPDLMALVAGVNREEYYVKMMVAWYFATALTKQREAAMPYLAEHRLPDWIHRKTVQKACESFRISPEDKAYLKTLV